MKNKRKPQTEQQVYQRLNQVVNNTYENLIDHIVIRINDQYVLNNQYAIKQDRDTGTSTVTRRRDDTKHKFNSIKLALVWSVLDYNKRYHESGRVQTLDSAVASLAVERKMHERLRNRDGAVYSSKIQQDTTRMKKYNDEINKYIRLANTLQNKELQK